MSIVPPLDTVDDTQAPSIQPETTTALKKKKKKRKKSTSETNPSADVNSCAKLSLKKRLFLKKSAKQTPWYDVNELINTGRDLLLALKLFPSPHNPSTYTAHVYASQSSPLGLTKDEYSRLHAALRRITLWRGRCDRGGRLPHAIDVTAGLAGVLLMDAERSRDASNINCSVNHSETMLYNQSGSFSLYHLRNSYSTLLLRSVNGLADTYRHQKKSALLSVAHCCSLAGLPLWIVDIRHDASHNDLPSLGVCRIGALESLKFWKGRYWDAMNEKVMGDGRDDGKSEIVDSPSSEGPELGIHTLALVCLMRYQKAVDVEAVERQKVLRNKKMKQEKKKYDRYNHWQLFSLGDTKQMEVVSDEIILLPSDENHNGKAKEDESSTKKQKMEENKLLNPWWILDDSKPKKKRERKVPDDEMNSNKSTISDAVEKGKALSAANTTPSSRDCASELIKKIPMDVLFSTTLQFLVWSTAVSSPDENDIASRHTELKGPALLYYKTSSVPVSEMEIEDVFEESRVSYEPLIVSIAGSYPGFFVSLFVNLIDSILCLDNEMKTQRMQASTRAPNNDYLNEMEWNLRCLSMWSRYIMTREFQMHLDRSVAITDPIINTTTNQVILEPIDLKKKGRRKWTPREQHFMQCPLPYQMLRDNNVPLNSVCDRLVLHLGSMDSVRDKNAKDVVEELIRFFERILGNNRVLFSMSESTLDSHVQSDVTPWVLCKSWDACAIGTMPGFPA